MDRQESKSEGAANQDMFLKLTDDLLILILSMLNCDLKFLCQYMLISKRFALLVSLISSGTLSVPIPKDRSSFEFFRCQVKYVLEALNSFPNIRSIHLEFIDEEYVEFDFKWKAVFGSNNCTSACLVYNSVTKLSSASARVSATAANSQKNKAIAMKSIFRRIVYPNMWRNLLAAWKPMVESVVITDSKRQGKVCFRNSELRDAGTCITLSDIWNSRFEEGRTSFKFFEVSELRLPKSGLLMEGAYLAICKTGEDSAENDMLNCNFGEEENVFAEVLNLILGTPEDRMKVYRRYAHGFYVSVIKIT